MSDKYPFLNKWLTDTDLEPAFEKYIDRFVGQFQDDFQPIIIKMLNHYEFYSGEKTSELLEEFATKVSNLIASVDSGVYFITLPISDSNVHNSDMLGRYFKNNPHFKLRIDDESLRKCDSLFIVDDYSGSGNTMIGFYRNKKSLLKQDCKVYSLPVFATKKAFGVLKNSKMICDDTITKIKYSHYYSEHKIISVSEKARFNFVSERFCRVRNKYIDGEYSTEDLFSLGYSTPNNTFGLFWYDDNTLYRPLFSRSRDQLLNIKTERMSHTLIKSISEALREGMLTDKMHHAIYIAVMRYCGFNDKEILKALGLSTTKFKDYVKYLKNKSVIQPNNDIDLKVLAIYVDIDKIHLYLQVGVRPVHNNQAEIELKLLSLIDKPKC